MRVLLDECLPRRLKRSLTDHEVVTVPEVGWAGKSNGELLQLANERFEVFVTVDCNFPAQRKHQLDMAIVVLATRSNRLLDIEALVPALRKALATISNGELVKLG